MEVKRVGVIGCGLMGSGIAQVAAQAGYLVTVSEISETLLKKGISAIKASLNIDVRRRRLTQENMDAVISRIEGVTALSALSGCDLVIEAAPENMAVKKQIFLELDRICPEHTILASNTSCLSVTDLGRVTGRPPKVLGLHFFNPVTVMRLLEVVRTPETSEETVAAGRAFGKAIGKVTILAPDTPGFVVNRLLMPLMLGALRMYETGQIAAKDIDNGAQLGLGHPMGPLKLADLVGLDTVLYIADSIYEGTKDPLYEPPEVLKKLVAEGSLGRKSGRGFYDYRRGEKAESAEGEPTENG